MSPQQVNDKPAERGINITNILLALLILLGGVFGTMMTNFMDNINNSVTSMDKSIQAIEVANSATVTEVRHLHDSFEACKETHRNIQTRITNLEKNK